MWGEVSEVYVAGWESEGVCMGCGGPYLSDRQGRVGRMGRVGCVGHNLPSWHNLPNESETWKLLIYFAW